MLQTMERAGRIVSSRRLALPQEMLSGNICTSISGRYTDEARRRASRSRALSKAIKKVRSVIWMPSSQPSFLGLREIASSRSRLCFASIVQQSSGIRSIRLKVSSNSATCSASASRADEKRTGSPFFASRGQTSRSLSCRAFCSSASRYSCCSA